jgi:hypothetical protein
VQRNNEWLCECSQDWGGIDCSVPLENICDDSKDNDNGMHTIKDNFKIYLSNVVINEFFLFFYNSI